MVPYDVQLIGGMVLHDGKIAEMGTGEGKTLVATLPSYLNALAGLGVHIVTVNDYLARRDSEWVGPILEFLMLNVDCIDKHKPHSPENVHTLVTSRMVQTVNLVLTTCGITWCALLMSRYSANTIIAWSMRWIRY